MAGKPKKIDEELLQWMAKRQCTQAEMAEALGVSVDTLSRRYAEDMTRWRSVGRTRLRAMQWRRACKGSDPMLIHLGKQYLGQTDKTQIDVVDDPFDPTEAYAANPELIERAIQLERDANAAVKALDALDAGADRLQGLAVPPARSGNGSVHNEASGRPDDKSGDSADPG